MAVVKRKRAHGITYYVTFVFDGRKVWERAGTDEREAKRLSRRRLREVAEGSYRGSRKSERPTVREYAEAWLAKRTCRWSADEEAYLRTYVLSREWYAGLRVEELEPRHSKQLVEELHTAWSERFRRTISPKTVSNIWSIVVVLCRDAQLDGLLKTDPCVLPPGLLKRRSTKKRAPYSVESIAKLLQCRDVHPTARVFAALAFMTGMREGEVCGRRWRNWDPNAKPLGALLVDTQYDGLPLKGDKFEAGEVARTVPVHPELARVLEWWRSDGFRLVYLRDPEPDDFIVPSGDGSCYGRSAAYGLFQRALATAGVENLTLHSTRHTFITLARRGGARADVLEKVTHNATGETIDIYTHWDWAPLCEAVQCLKLTGDAYGDVSALQSQNIVAPPGLEPGTDNETTGAHPELPSSGEDDDPPVKQAILPLRGANCAARHQRRPAPWVHEATANLACLLAGAP